MEIEENQCCGGSGERSRAFNTVRTRKPYRIHLSGGEPCGAGRPFPARRWEGSKVNGRHKFFYGAHDAPERGKSLC
jgi:hypothetical protein